MNRVSCLFASGVLLLAGCAAPLRLHEDYRTRAFDRPGAPPPYPQRASLKLEQSPLRHVTLAQARRLAIERNHTVKQATASVEEARARIGEARAAFLPTLTGTLSRTLNQKVTEVSIPGGGSFFLSPKYISRGQARLSISLFAFGRDKAAVAAARANLDSEFMNERLAKQQLLFETTQAWYRIHEAASDVQVVEDSLQAAQQQLQDARNIFLAGRSAKDAVLTAKVNQLTEDHRLLVAKNALKQARRVLNVLLARPVDAPLDLAPAPPFWKVKLDQAMLVAWARRHNPGLGALRSARVALNKQRESQALSWAPEISGILGADYSSFRQGTGFSTNYTATVSVQFTPINGGRRITRLQEIHAQLARISEQEQQAMLTLDQNIAQTIQNIQELEHQVLVSREAVVAAKENYRILANRFKNGKTTSREVLDAQVTLSNSKNALHRAVFGQRIQLAQLEALVGVPEEAWLKRAP